MPLPRTSHPTSPEVAQDETSSQAPPILRTVATYSMPAEAHAPLSRLHSAGIHAEVRDDATLHLNWLWSQAIGGVKIEVPDEDEAAARAILELEPSEEGLLRCPHCQSAKVKARPLPPAAALFLFINLPIPCPLVRIDCHTCCRTHDVARA